MGFTIQEDTDKWWVYDIEVYPNAFLFGCVNQKGKVIQYEISPWANQITELVMLLKKMSREEYWLIGFNNIGYDYPVLHDGILSSDAWKCRTSSELLTRMLHRKSKEIINLDFNDRFKSRVPELSHFVRQVDLYLTNHFDNEAKRTNLKALEINMRLPNVMDLPFDPNEPLTRQQFDDLKVYHRNDLYATSQFMRHNVKALQFRIEMSELLGVDVINSNDTKIGKGMFIHRLEERLGIEACFNTTATGRKPKQTHRDRIALSDCIFQTVKMTTPEFRSVVNFLKAQVIKTTKGVFTDLSLDKMKSFIQYTPLYHERPAVREWVDSGFNGPEPRTPKKMRRLSVVLDGVEFAFGTGGIHGSLNNTRIEETDDYAIVDLDVTSYYPSLAIVNKVYPEHLGPEFCNIYAELKEERLRHKKGSAPNKALKLALNGVYGDSNNKYGPFYDPMYTMKITVNGQLLLCMLYEKIRSIQGLRLLQINTDGLTVYLPRKEIDTLMTYAAAWERYTGLQLERADYRLMHIRDVNNYIAVSTNGKVKRKGAYAFVLPWEDNPELDWHQDHSNLASRKAASENIINGRPVMESLVENRDPFDFMLRVKVAKTHRLEADYDLGLVVEEQKTSRVHIVKGDAGAKLTKIMPPISGKEDKGERRQAVFDGARVQFDNVYRPEMFDWSQVDYDWYKHEAEKLIAVDEVLKL